MCTLQYSWQLAKGGLGRGRGGWRREKGTNEISDGLTDGRRSRASERDWRSCSSAPAAKISYTHHGVAHRHCRAGSCRRSLRAKVAVPAWCRPRPPSSAPSVLAKYGYRFRAQFNTKWKIGLSAGQRPREGGQVWNCGPESDKAPPIWRACERGPRNQGWGRSLKM